ncbi:formate dehydrogenase [Herbaspirillum sp. meg3]|jgi:formate dehydrogenase subunit delta|uniref:formate dehydrogenase subunit delta n=1 Tax=Herbaspirillum sp. meg3 TaxID=2025949 RepID=UPI000B999587|nr:formate dehydrogenase subunit delta [Herbaspirillum sp. meg3]ASU39658.1 formate dehydrogenase [Herbaspirillum sp. meg3]
MNLPHLIKMANQIGTFFSTMPDHEQAVMDLASHIKRFWEPRMRRALLLYVDEKGGEELSDIVRESVKLHHAMLAA